MSFDASGETRFRVTRRLRATVEARSVSLPTLLGDLEGTVQTHACSPGTLVCRALTSRPPPKKLRVSPEN
jgi:hypothetical protein